MYIYLLCFNQITIIKYLKDDNAIYAHYAVDAIKNQNFYFDKVYT